MYNIERGDGYPWLYNCVHTARAGAQANIHGMYTVARCLRFQCATSSWRTSSRSTSTHSVNDYWHVLMSTWSWRRLSEGCKLRMVPCMCARSRPQVLTSNPENKNWKGAWASTVCRPRRRFNRPVERPSNLFTSKTFVLSILHGGLTFNVHVSHSIQ